jgi:two-component system CheB/CheR fusion protein
MAARKKTVDGEKLRKAAATPRKSGKTATGRKKLPAPAAEETSSSPAVTEPETGKAASPEVPFVVGIGGSAGSLEALGQFFHNLPADTGLAYILVTHLDPTHKGVMPELIQRLTAMKVMQAKNGMKVRADSVYIIPPNRDMAILHGKLQLLEPSAPRGLRLPIDFFLQHLAEDQKERSIGIILSGMGSDGTIGLRAIKEQLGMVMVQDPANAKYDSMPRSAIATGGADIVAPAEELPAKLLGYVAHYTTAQATPAPVDKKTSSAFQRILLLLLRSKTGTDFSLYKKTTILRRIDRRMGLHQIPNMANYASFLQENPHEIELIFKELLINVTNFFRDPEAFELVRENVILPLLREREGSGTIRVWVPGCSSGEEVYSLAILFRECMEQEPGLTTKIQMYGTDLDQDAITTARQGIYPATIAADVSPERLQRYFTKEETNYRIRKEIRDRVVFAPQNLIGDPPFTRLDLISCRNLLIYLTAEIQKRILPLFHYSLLPGGYLFLGSSESVSGYNDLFTPVDQKWKIFRRRESLHALTALPEFPVHQGITEWQRQQLPKKSTTPPAPAFEEVVQRIIIETITPPVLIINRKGDLLYSTRRTGKYLEPVVGTASLNVIGMAREGLKTELAIAMRGAINQNHEVRVEDVMVKTNGTSEPVNLTVRPLPGEGGNLNELLMVVFDETPHARRRQSRAGHHEDRSAAIAELEKDLQYTKEHLQSTIEEMETSQEELKSTNEELESTNEELQSTNEEMTTSKEELQSLNEEMMTVNTELQAKNDELSVVNNDMRNLLNSTQIPTLFLDNNLRIKRYTPPATAIFTLIPGDVGRPITDIASRLKYHDLVKDVHGVLDTLIFRETQVQVKDGQWFIMRIMPYRTIENLIDGVVITFSNITDLKTLEQVLEEHDRLCLLAGVTRELDDPVIVQDLAGTIRVWNKGAEHLYGWTEPEVLGRNAHDFIAKPGRAEYNAVMERVRSGEPVHTFLTERLVKGGGTVVVTCTVTHLSEKGKEIAIATTERVTGKKGLKKTET